MPNTEYRVSFKGDMGNLQQFISSVGTGLGRGIRQSYQAQAVGGARSMTPSGASPDMAGARNLTTSIDGYNRTITQTGQIFHKFVTGWTADVQRLDAAATKLGAKLGKGGAIYGTPASVKAGRVGIRMADLVPQYDEFFTGDYTSKPGNLDRVEAANRRLQPYRAAQERQDLVRTGLNLRSEARQQSFVDLGQDKVSDLTLGLNDVVRESNKTLKKLTAQSKAIAAKIRGVPLTSVMTGAELDQIYGSIAAKRTAAGRPMPYATSTDMLAGASRTGLTKGSPADMEAVALKKDILKELYDIRGGTKVQADIQKLITTTDGRVAKIKGEIVTAETETLALVEQDQAKQRLMNKKMDASAIALNKKHATDIAFGEAAARAAPDVPRDLGTLLKSSGALRKDFVKQMGITSPMFTDQKAGIFSESFKKELLSKDITATATRDFEKGLTRLGGSIKDINGLTGEWSYTLDKNGKLVQTWGRNLRGPANMLQQVGRDFQKVIEWTVATTAVFGAIGLVMGSFSKINQVNSDLQRFQITAKTTGEETKRAFDMIAQVAYETATPLGELTSVMDDIALATRRTSQTTEAWFSNQKNLAEAVGILTNITGMDTLKATDTLTSAYKQLGISTSDLKLLLSKLTAAGGGNAQAVTDIATALGGLSEAGRAAGLTLDQMIGAVQTLSQVTNKTAADTATAFKNLFGAINAPASEKMLKTFGINIRTEAGQLRPFLDIYQDIYDAKQKGIIQEGRYQDVLRAISGGPRRAPDAAAILSNFTKISEAIRISEGASNEALIANAKILSTNQAKMQQIRTAFDTALVDKFSKAVDNLVTLFTQIADVLTKLFGGLPDAIGATIIQMGILLASMALLRKSLIFVKGQFGGMMGPSNGPTGIANTSGIINGPLNRIASRLAPIGPPTPKFIPIRLPVTLFNSLPSQVANAQKVRGVPSYPQYSNLPPRADTSPFTVLPHRQYGETRPPTPLGVRTPSGRLVDPVTRRYVGNAGNAPRPLLPAGANVIKMLQVDRFDLKDQSGGFKQTIGRAVASGLRSVGDKSMGLGAGMLGVAGGLALGAAAGKDASAIATAIGLPLAMMGGPASAAGIGLMGVGAALEFLSQSSKKAEESISKARVEVFDLADAYLNQMTEVESAKAAQLESAETLDILGSKLVLTSLETSALTEHQIEYADSTNRLMVANESLYEIQKKLLETLPMLGAGFETLIDLATGGFTPEEIKSIKVAMAKEILVASGQLGTPGISTTELLKPKPQDTYQPGLAVPGAPDSVKNLGATDELLKNLTQGNWKELNTKMSGPFQRAEIIRSDELIVAGKLALANATAEEKRTTEYAKAFEAFSLYVAEFGTYTERLNLAVNTQKAKVLQAGLTGELAGQPYKNAEQRVNLAATLEGIKTETPNITPTQTNELTAEIEKLLKQDWISDISKQEAMDIYTTVTKINGQFTEINKRGLLEPGAVDWFKDRMMNIPGLTDTVKGVLELKEDIEAAIKAAQDLDDALKASFEGSAMDLGKQLLSLQAARQSGDITASQYAGQSAEVKAYMALNKELNVELRKTPGTLNALGDALSGVQGLYGLQYASIDQLNVALINWGQTLGLTPEKIREVMKAVGELNALLLLLQTLEDTRVTIRLNVIKTTVGGNDVIDAAGRAALDANQKAQDAANARVDKLIALLTNVGQSGDPGKWDAPAAAAAAKQVGLMDLPPEFKTDPNRTTAQLLQEAIKNAKALQHSIPGADKEYKGQMVAILDGTKKVMTTTNIGEEYLRRAMEELTEQIKKQNELLTKADTIRRIRVGAGDFAALANVPINSKSGISVGGPQGPITISLNITGQVLTEAQIKQLGNSIAAGLGSAIGTN